MTAPDSDPRPYEWTDYYTRFDYFTSAAVRDGCYPRRMEHAAPVERAIVLVHGLTDSPHFMTAIGKYFFESLGYNVYLPLLHMHGLREPDGMRGVAHHEWFKNVTYAIDTAAARASRLSIGGLSTGGTLSMHALLTDERINDAAYLFSAALRLQGKLGEFGGAMRERLLDSPLVDWVESDAPLIGSNPYRYCRMVFAGGRELMQVMSHVDARLKAYSARAPLRKRIFAAHSEADTTAGIHGIEALQDICALDAFYFARIADELQVPHASVVLRDPVYASDAAPDAAPLEPANPVFGDMLNAMARFQAG